MAVLTQSLIDLLPKNQRAAYPAIKAFTESIGFKPSRGAIVGGVPYSFNKTEIAQQVREVGYKINTQSLNDIIDVIRNKADVGQFIRTFGPNAIIPQSVHTIKELEFSGGAKVQYLVSTNTSNPLIPEAIYVNADAPLNADQIYGKAIASFTYEEGSGMSPGDLSDVTFSIDDARYSPGEALTGEYKPYEGLGAS